MNKEICLLGFIDKEKREKIGYYLFFSGIMLELLVMVTDNAANFTIPYRGRLTHVAFLLFCIKSTSNHIFSFNIFKVVLLILTPNYFKSP